MMKRNILSIILALIAVTQTLASEYVYTPFVREGVKWVYYYANEYASVLFVFQGFGDLEILNSRVQNLSWTHYRMLLRVPDENARYWYLREASEEMWSVRTLSRNIGSQYYYRLLQSPQKEKVIAEMQELTKPLQQGKDEIVKNPVVAEFLGLENTDYSESNLEQAIINHLQKFIMEMGRGFAYMGRQQLIRTDTQDYYIDLVLTNFLLFSHRTPLSFRLRT